MEQPSLPTKWQHSVSIGTPRRENPNVGIALGSYSSSDGRKTLFLGTSRIATGLQTAYQNELVFGHVYEYTLTLGRIQFHNSPLQDLPSPHI